MTTTTGDQVDQLRSLKQSLFIAFRFHNGFASVQALVRKSFVDKLITNEVQKAILEACQPLQLGTASDPYTSTKMVSAIEGLINDEILAARRAMNVG